MNQAILLESNADNIDFMIHGIFSIKVFGQEVCFIIITVLPIVLHLLYRPLFLRL